MNQVFAYQWLVSSFDTILEQFADSPVSFTESDALKSSHWDLGEDARLRDDARFRPTPWGRWILSSYLLANDMLYRQLQEADRSELPLVDVLTDLQSVAGRPLMFCPKDPRFVYEQGLVRLASGELSNRPKLEKPLELEKYITHLPLHTLAAVAASEPAGEWGPQAQEEMIETLGWVRVRLPGHRLNDRMFIAQIKGNSMDNGHNGLTDGAYAVFQLWPSGTKQEKIILVRGSFSDPETGVYALKKYLADIRNREGRHQIIKLVSLNPDKDKYPDIVLQPEVDDTLLSIAELIAPLSPGDYGRVPVSSGKKGKRDLTSAKAQEKIADRLQKTIETFFEGQLEKTEDVGDEERQEVTWSARFICLDAAAGGLHIEAGPLAGLPLFAKKLSVACGVQKWETLASNFRTKTWRIPITPSTESYHWSAPGFEDVLEEELSVMCLDGLSATSVTAFRVDAAGVGLALTGQTLTPGQTYRLLVPPSFLSTQLPIPDTFPLGEDWRLWQLELPDNPDAKLRAVLSSLNLNMGKSEPSLSWVIVPPALYRQAPSGESYPCFSVGQVPILYILGLRQELEGNAVVFLSGPGLLQTIQLTQGDAWTIAIADLEPGKYMVQVLFESSNVEPARMPFAVEAAPVRTVSASVTADVEGVHYDVHQVGSVMVRGNYAWFEGLDIPIDLTGPALWPVFVAWKSGKSRRLKLEALQEDGCLDVDKVRTLTEDLRLHCRAANLVVDCRELGRLTLQLDRKMDPNELAASIKSHVINTAQTAAGLAGQFALLRSVWLAPLLSLMNYNIFEMEPSYLLDAPARTTALKLFETSRTPEGDVQEELRRVLVLVMSDADLHHATHGTVWEYAEALCWKCGVFEAIITDGFCWFVHKRGSKLVPPMWDLRKLSDDKASFDMEGFLSSCAVGV